jgi:hypothetical protein
MSFFSDFWIFFEPDQKNGAGNGNSILEMIDGWLFHLHIGKYP